MSTRTLTNITAALCHSSSNPGLVRDPLIYKKQTAQQTIDRNPAVKL